MLQGWNIPYNNISCVITARVFTVRRMLSWLTFTSVLPAAALVVVNTVTNIPVGLLLPLSTKQKPVRVCVTLLLLVVSDYNVNKAC